MAEYPTALEIRSGLTDEALEALVDGLPSYSTSPVTLVKLDLPSVTPSILAAYAMLVEAVQAEYPTAKATTDTITRQKTHDELETEAIQSEQSRVYYERQANEKAAE
jgi:hypothetical protein